MKKLPVFHSQYTKKTGGGDEAENALGPFNKNVNKSKKRTKKT